MTAGRERLGVVYLFGGTHLFNTQWNLSDPDAAWIRATAGHRVHSPVRQGGFKRPDHRRFIGHQQRRFRDIASATKAD